MKSDSFRAQKLGALPLDPPLEVPGSLESAGSGSLGRGGARGCQRKYLPEALVVKDQPTTSGTASLLNPRKLISGSTA